MQAMPRVHSRVTRNNTPKMLPESREEARSKGERNDENSRELATSEGEKLETTEVMASDWCDQPQEKRRSVTKKKSKLLWRSKRFAPEQNVWLDKLEIIEEEEEASATEQPSF